MPHRREPSRLQRGALYGLHIEELSYGAPCRLYSPGRPSEDFPRANVAENAAWTLQKDVRGHRVLRGVRFPHVSYNSPCRSRLFCCSVPAVAPHDIDPRCGPVAWCASTGRHSIDLACWAYGHWRHGCYHVHADRWDTRISLSPLEDGALLTFGGLSPSLHAYATTGKASGRDGQPGPCEHPGVLHPSARYNRLAT